MSQDRSRLDVELLPRNAAAIARLKTEISALATPCSPTRVLRAPRPSRCVGARRFNGATYVIAVNTSWRRVTARVSAPNLRGAARVFGENRVVRVRRGAIRDRFEPLDVNVYVLR